MCFSANACFGSFILLSMIGVAAVAKTKSSSQVMFASIPFVFAIQQMTQGFIWVYVKTDHSKIFLTQLIYLYLTFAYIFWPSFIPISILLFETNSFKRKVLRVISFFGIVLSIFYSYCLIHFPVSLKFETYHLKYILGFPIGYLIIGNIFYGMTTVIPLFISGIKKMKWLGILIVVSYVFTLIFYQEYTISVWCYFSALISVVIYFIINQECHTKE